MSSGRSRAFTATQLQRASSWRVLNAIFAQRGLLGEGGAEGVLGLHVYASSIGECWQGSFVDWIVAAVAETAKTHGYSVEVLAVHRLNVVQNRIALVFRVAPRNAESVHASAARVPSALCAAADPACGDGEFLFFTVIFKYINIPCESSSQVDSLPLLNCTHTFD